MSAQLSMIDQEQTALATSTSIVDYAIAKGINPDLLDRLFELQLRVQAEQARREYNEAMAAFKRIPVVIEKNKHVKFETSKGVTEYDHATLDNVVDVVTPALSAFGIRFNWEQQQDTATGIISVTCVTSHITGHTERNTLVALPDNSGGKNAIQAVSSTVSYLRRYTLMGALGLAEKGSDDDGQKAGSRNNPAMPEQDVVSFLDVIEAAATTDDLQKFFKAAYTAAEKVGDKAARDAFIKAKDKRKKELQ